MELDAIHREEILNSSHCIVALMRCRLACKLNCCKGSAFITWKIELFSTSAPSLSLFSTFRACCSFLFSITLCKVLSITKDVSVLLTPLTQRVPENSLTAAPIREAWEVLVICVCIIVTLLFLAYLPLSLLGGHAPERHQFLYSADPRGHIAPRHSSANRNSLACWKSSW